MAVVLDQVRDDGALVRGHDGQKEKKKKGRLKKRYTRNQYKILQKRTFIFIKN